MLVTGKLVRFLNRVFTQDPSPFLGLRIQYAGGMQWNVNDETLTLTVQGGVGASQVIDLTAYTLAGLSGYVAGLPGYSVLNLDSTRSGLSARVLLDGSGDQSTSNGDHLYAYTSPLWAYMDAVGQQLHVAKLQVANLPAEMSLTTGDGAWLDEIGGYYGVPRISGELDPVYGARIIAQVVAPKGNNIAIAQAILAATGQVAVVTDQTLVGSGPILFNGTYTFNGSHVYGGSTATQYGLFDVTYAFDLINGLDSASYAAAITALIEQVRDAGTHLRTLVLTGSTLSDAFQFAPTDNSDSLVLNYANNAVYDGTYNYDGTIAFNLVLTVTEGVAG